MACTEVASEGLHDGCEANCDDDSDDSDDGTYDSANHADYCYFCDDYGGNCEEYCYDTDECPDQWCEEGGCDWDECV